MVATVRTIEFQKHGLPHMHLLTYLDQPYKFRNPEDVDTLVSAQIPDPATHPTLYMKLFLPVCFMVHVGQNVWLMESVARTFPRAFMMIPTLGKMVRLCQA